jgi:hypothetical protein
VNRTPVTLVRRFQKLDGDFYPLHTRICMMLADKPDRMSGDNERLWWHEMDIIRETNCTLHSLYESMLYLTRSKIAEKRRQDHQNYYRLRSLEW